MPQQNVKHRSTVYWVELQEDDKVVLICHSGKGKNMFHKFLSRSKAVELIKAEKKLNPENKYRIAKETSVTERSNWE